MQGKSYFIEVKEMIGQENNEVKNQEIFFSNLKGANDVHKKAIINWMEQKIDEYSQNQVTAPRIGLGHHRMVDKGLGKIYREFDEAGKTANTSCPICVLDEKYMKVFIEFITKKLQIHIGQKGDSEIKPGNVRKLCKIKTS
jgi:hypothetical protein